MKLVLQVNDLKGASYVEPFAGGAGVALGLLFDNYVDKIFINDIDPAIYAFWHSVLNNADELCALIYDTPVTIGEWHNQKEIFYVRDVSDLLSFGFSTFFLNRTNRSGILKGGVIGGLNQSGKWRLDARFNKKTLIDKIQKIYSFRDQVVLSNLDVREFINEQVCNFHEKTLSYIDPPYFHKGRGLYLNALSKDDHILIAHCIKNSIKSPWIISYDNTPEISCLYSDYRKGIHSLNYSASTSYEGSEIIIYSNNLEIPDVGNPFRITKADYEKNIVISVDKNVSVN